MLKERIKIIKCIKFESSFKYFKKYINVSLSLNFDLKSKHNSSLDDAGPVCGDGTCPPVCRERPFNFLCF